MSDRPKIYVKPHGSIRVTGAADFVDAEGNVIETKENFSLCRCGHSKEKPFCDRSETPSEAVRGPQFASNHGYAASEPSSSPARGH